VAGTLVGRYELEVPLGRGAMGEVWRGWDLATRQQVAVKLATIDDSVLVAETIARFRREADTLGRLRHPNIISGLAAAHTIGVVHRDIKPSNLMVSARGQLTIVDFGIARLLEDTSPRLTAPSETAGTLLYMSPEQEGRHRRGRGRHHLHQRQRRAGHPPVGQGRREPAHRHGHCRQRRQQQQQVRVGLKWNLRGTGTHHSAAIYQFFTPDVISAQSASFTCK
jgi:Protein kinase domain